MRVVSNGVWYSSCTDGDFKVAFQHMGPESAKAREPNVPLTNCNECWMRQPEWSVARGSSTVVWHSYYMPIFTGLTCTSTSGTNSVWWCVDARTALLHSIWRYTGHQSLRLHNDGIFGRLPAINWQCRRIRRSNTAVGRLLWLARRHGTHCQNICVTPPKYFCFWPSSQNIHFSQSTSVYSALEAMEMMRYINLRFTLHYTFCLQIITDNLLFQSVILY